MLAIHSIPQTFLGPIFFRDAALLLLLQALLSDLELVNIPPVLFVVGHTAF